MPGVAYNPYEPQSFRDELRAMKVFNIRDHLARYPRELVRFWWSVEGDLPRPTSMCAYRRCNAGEPPSRKLFKGSSDGYVLKPSLRVIIGGK